jgi:hypothetical protein
LNRTFAFAVSVILLALVFAEAPSAQVINEPTSDVYFGDDFDGLRLNTSLWTAQANTNTSGYPSYGGEIRLADSQIFLESNGTSFPYLCSAVNPFPLEGDFSMEFDLTYLRISTRGCGLWVTNGEWTVRNPSTNSKDYYANIFQLWPNEYDGEINDGGVRLFLLGEELHDTQRYTGKNLYRLEYKAGTYFVFINDALVASAESELRPEMIGIGHFPAYWVPVNDGLDISGLPLYSYAWCDFKIDKISVRTAKPAITAALSLSTVASTVQIGSAIDFNGKLTSNETIPIVGELIVLSYLVPGAGEWIPLSSVTTDSDGAYSVTWIPTATGNFVMKAEWKDSESGSKAVVTKSISILRSASKSLFYVESNSTLSSMSFNATENVVSFNVSGSSGTMGSVKFIVSKELVPDPDVLQVYLDNRELEYTVVSGDGVWVLNFFYTHSMHDVLIKMQTSNGDFPLLYTVLIVFVSISASSVVLGLTVYFKKHQRGKSP